MDKEEYRKKIIEMVEKIDNMALLKRLYQLAVYLYVHKYDKE